MILWQGQNLGRIECRIANWQYTVAPDGRFLINSLPANTASPLTLVTGWDVSLRQR
jgi:hypothetical protein